MYKIINKLDVAQRIEVVQKGTPIMRHVGPEDDGLWSEEITDQMRRAKDKGKIDYEQTQRVDAQNVQTKVNDEVNTGEQIAMADGQGPANGVEPELQVHAETNEEASLVDGQVNETVVEHNAQTDYTSLDADQETVTVTEEDVGNASDVLGYISSEYTNQPTMEEVPNDESFEDLAPVAEEGVYNNEPSYEGQ